jgi:hypothetical protein
MKKILNFCNKIKTILFNLFRWFRKRKIASIPKEAESREMARLVDTKQPGPNMPKRQPCPNGHGWKRRIYKTLSGAYYHCGLCGDFFVRSA